MRAFFSSLLYVSLIGGLGSALAGKAYKRHFQALVALLCCALTVHPLLQILPSVETDFSLSADVTTAETLAKDLVLEQTKADAAFAIEEYIFKQTGIKLSGVCIDIESEGDVLYTRRVQAIAPTAAEAETARTALAAAFGKAVEIEVECEA